MSARLFDRLAALMSMLILVGLGLLSYFLAQQAERMAVSREPRPVTHEPDYFVDRLILLKANSAGQPSVRVEAEQMRHFPDDLTVEFDTPRVLTLTDNRPVIRITARRGTAPDSGEKVDLFGNVRIVRDAVAGDPELIVTTEAATVIVDSKQVTSRETVDIRHGANRLTGTGMFLDSQSRQLTLDSRVKSSITADTPVPGAPSGR